MNSEAEFTPFSEEQPAASEQRKSGRPAGKSRPPGHKKKKKQSGLSTAILIALMVIGAGIMAYPFVSNWWNGMHASRAIAAYSQNVSATDEAELEAMLSAAAEYNRRLAEKEKQYFMTVEEIAQYNTLLDPSGTGLMAYVTIPAIKETMPVYHGTDEAVLQTAVGHLEWTSLPVGGESTHAVLSGHRGLPRARLFSDLDRLKTKDTFSVTVLNRTLTYEVDQILVVLPSEVDALNIVPGEDYCTLVTCTPYGINTHRMLVRGHRIENPSPQADGEEAFPEEAKILQPLMKIIAVAVPALLLFLIAALMRQKKKRRAMRTAARKRVQRGKHE